MSFLKDFKQDLTQAVSGRVTDGEQKNEEASEVMSDVPVEEESAGEGHVDVAAEMADGEISAAGEINIEEAVYEQQDQTDTTYDAETMQETQEDDAPSDELTEITKGTSITGDITTIGSMNVYGTIDGDVMCRGKMIITGTVRGKIQAGEIFANNSKREGDINSDGSVKVGNGSVIIGNIYATSAVIAGAIKGDIDIHGPVIVDATAVVQGNIKSRSVQINNGAVIEGYCSQCYAEVDYKTLFEDAFDNK